VSAFAKLAAFAGVLVVVFGAATLAGGAVDPIRWAARTGVGGCGRCITARGD
jgi:hypothetical protein